MAGFFEHVGVWILWKVPRVAVAGHGPDFVALAEEILAEARDRAGQSHDGLDTWTVQTADSGSTR